MTVWPIAPPLPRRQVVGQLVAQCAAAGLPAPITRYRIGAWTWPLAWPAQRLLVDLAAGRYPDGRLVRGLAHPPDAKRNAATLAGWRVLTFGPQGLADGTAVRQIAAALGGSAPALDAAPAPCHTGATRRVGSTADAAPLEPPPGRAGRGRGGRGLHRMSPRAVAEARAGNGHRPGHRAVAGGVRASPPAPRRWAPWGTFTRVEDVEPTNHAAERALRRSVAIPPRLPILSLGG